MKILDRYVARNFLVGYLIALLVLIGMCITIDLFVHLDEFAEHADMGPWRVLVNIGQFYSVHSTLWFRDLAGMIIVIAAVFSLTKMTRNNELIAIMASGGSLKRVLAPIIVLSAILTGLQVLDQEVVIPSLASLLTRSHDDLPGSKTYDLWFAADSNNNLICTKAFDEKTSSLYHPFFILRERLKGTDRWIVTGKINAQKGVYDARREGWTLTNALLSKIPQSPDFALSGPQTAVVDFFPTDLTPQQIPMRRQERYKSLLSSRQLMALAKNEGTRDTDLADLYLQKHTRITDPLMNLIMLLVALPVLVCRDPRNMKTAITVSFAATASCFVLTFLCKMFAAEPFFNQVRPELWAWAPVFIFLPIAVVEIDSMRT